MYHLPASLAEFDSGRIANAHPIRILGRGASVPKEAEQAANIMRFTGGLGQVISTPIGLLVGRGSGSEPFFLGSAAASVGPGDYYVPAGLDDIQALGWALGAYAFSAFKKSQPSPTLILPEGANVRSIARMASAAMLVRDLVNMPAESMGPDDLEASTRALAASFQAQVEVISGDALIKGFPLIHAVGRAAAVEPRLIELRWGDRADPAITLVGKGVCFDSGGLNIKGAAGMGLMKKDMGGAANVLGLAMMIMEAGLSVSLRVLIPAVENAISGNAFRPGDVFRSRAGLTVEISNTDAEGRLVLADALAYAAEEKPARIISLATLTGAARVALGPDLPPVYSTDQAFVDALVAVGEDVADPLWQLPLWSRYDEYLKSAIADVNHASRNSFAGSVTAALFLKRFVPSEIPYTHFDIFAWVPSARPGRPIGGEAMAIRALFEVIASQHPSACASGGM